MLPDLEELLQEQPGASSSSFTDSYRQQSSMLEQYISQQPFVAIRDLLLDIVLGKRQLKSAWNPSLQHGAIMVRAVLV
jgi:hypothetical protein